MRITTLFIPLLLVSSFLSAQKATVLTGRVFDRATKEPVIGANVSLADTYDGATTDPNGLFSFETTETGDQILRVTALSYDSLSQKLRLTGDTLRFELGMKEAFNELKVVVISAGSFEASDEKKVTVLKPLDIVTTASANGDTYSALKTLPGTQVSTGDQEGLFVRGGTSSEAPTFIDGLLVRNPFFASTPDFASRGRFNPFIFKGTVFSTGGYSAQYGQGMSSALALETQDLPERSAGNLAISSVGVGVGQQYLWAPQGRGAGFSVNYTNLAPYFLLIKQKPDFTHKPEFIGTEGFFRQKTGASGMLKFYGYYNHGRVGFRAPGPEELRFGFDVKNDNVYTNLTWQGALNGEWQLRLGLSHSHDWNDISTSYSAGFLQPDTFKFQNTLTQFRTVATRYFGRLTALRFGAEYQYSTDNFNQVRYGSSELTDHYQAVFAETDLYITNQLVARVGVRGENSSLLGKANIAPRISVAYKIGVGDQFSFAYGQFYQKGDSLLRWQNQYNQVPGWQRADHYILNYQYSYAARTFRIETFYKKYHDLVTTTGELTNNGTGYAQGIEVFYRDKKIIKNLDFWISYSYLDTKRRFQWYPLEVQPTYAANHVASLVVKRFFTKLRTNFGITYSYATGRPFYNPNLSESQFLTERTPEYHNFSVSASYLTTIRKAFAVIVLGVTNVFNQEQIFGYRYSSDGQIRTAITPGANQFVFVGAFISWGIDRRQEVLDKN